MDSGHYIELRSSLRSQHWHRVDAVGDCLTERKKNINLNGNTIFITGGGSGIGRGFAEALHKRGNQVIISGRRKSHLAQYPKLDVLINNAGIMQIDGAAGVVDDDVLVSTVNTNLLGSIRVTSALIEHLKKQPVATIVFNTSVLAFVPMAATSVYSSTKAALHSYVLAQRFKLRSTSVKVLELAPRGCGPI